MMDQLISDEELRKQLILARIDAFNQVAGALWENRQLPNANDFRKMVEVMIREETKKLPVEELEKK
jgi:hypothetical protein